MYTQNILLPLLMSTSSLHELQREAKDLARRYYKHTGRPLGVTGEVAEFEAARILNLDLADVRQAGWDATGRSDRGQTERLQIKGRCIVDQSKRSTKLGRIDIAKEWDAIILVLLDATYSATAIYRAEREEVVAALERPGSKARNERGQLALSKFKAIGRQVWPVA